MLAANALVTGKEFETYMDPTLTGSGDVAVPLEEAVNRASDLIAAYLGRTLITPATDLIEYHSLDSYQSEIQLREWPIVSVTEVCEDVTRVYGSALVVNTDYIVSKPGGKLIRVDAGAGVTCWATGFRAIRVKYKPGFAIADVPARFKDACLEVAATLWKMQQRQNWGVNTMVDQGGNFTRFSVAHLPPSIKEQLIGECAPSFGHTGERDA